MSGNDYILRGAAMPDGFCVGVSCQECPFCDDLKGGCKVARFIEAIPAADVEKVRHGYYICRTDEFGRLKMICSVCKEETGMSYRAKKEHLRYCPNCGARLDVTVTNVE